MLVLLFYTRIYSLIKTVFLKKAMSSTGSSWSLKHLLLQRSRISKFLPPCLLLSLMEWFLGMRVTLYFLYTVFPIPESCIALLDTYRWGVKQQHIRALQCQKPRLVVLPWLIVVKDPLIHPTHVFNSLCCREVPVIQLHLSIILTTMSQWTKRPVN